MTTHPHRRHALRRAGIAEDGRRTLRTTIEAVHAEQVVDRLNGPRHPQLTLVACSAMAAVGGIATAGALWLAGGPWGVERAGVGAAGVVSVVAATIGVRKASRRLPLRRVVIAAGIVATAWAMFAVGAATQLTIDGQPVLTISETATSARLADSLEREIYTMRDLDALLALDANRARIAVQEIEAAVPTFDVIAVRNEERATSGVPGAWADAVTSVRDAAVLGSEAAAAKHRATQSSDAASVQRADTTRAAFVSAWLRAGQHVSEAARVSGVPLGPPRELQE